MKNKILATVLTILLAAQVTLAAPFNANAKTKRIPAGTKFALKMLTPIDTGYSSKGSEFTAMLVTDQKADDDVIANGFNCSW